MGLVKDEDKAKDLMIPCKVRTFPKGLGEPFVTKAGVLGALSDEQEETFCDPKVSEVKKASPKMVAVRKAFRGSATMTFMGCIRETDRDALLGILTNKEAIKVVNAIPKCTPAMFKAAREAKAKEA